MTSDRLEWTHIYALEQAVLLSEIQGGCILELRDYDMRCRKFVYFGPGPVLALLKTGVWCEWRRCGSAVCKSQECDP